MTKTDIDSYFTENWAAIQKAVKDNAHKCYTANADDITSDIYLICIEKAPKIKNLGGFIRILASNIYRWEKSDFNKNNVTFANNVNFDDTLSTEDDEEHKYQRRVYALEMYRRNAEPHEKRFLEIYFDHGITTVRGLQEHLNVSYHGAVTILKDFKLKLRDYEREE
jgi:hypothetical protein